jgi:hypothetical protein
MGLSFCQSLTTLGFYLFCDLLLLFYCFRFLVNLRLHSHYFFAFTVQLQHYLINLSSLLIEYWLESLQFFLHQINQLLRLVQFQHSLFEFADLITNFKRFVFQKVVKLREQSEKIARGHIHLPSPFRKIYFGLLYYRLMDSHKGMGNFVFQA